MCYFMPTVYFPSLEDGIANSVAYGTDTDKQFAQLHADNIRQN